MTTCTVRGFFGPWRWLSTFWPADVAYQAVMYSTVEHAYQAAKTSSPLERQMIRACPTPGQAARMGRRLTHRADWDTVKVLIMLELLRRKFAREPLRSQLVATDPLYLVEENRWGDRFWGVCDGHGENMLGRLLMRVRNEQRAMPSPTGVPPCPPR